MTNIKFTSNYFSNWLSNWMKHGRNCLILAGILLLIIYSDAEPLKDIDIDYFILSVRWLPSACISYKAKRPSNYCILPANPTVWVLHGLWPQKGHSPGPFYCHPELVFEASSLAPIRNDLNLYWPNVYGGETSESFWKHEWDKHGTCAVEQPSLRDLIHFFNTTVSLFHQHNMNAYFSAINIWPSQSGLIISDLNFHLKRVVGRSFRIKCTYANGRHYLAEIRLCLNKNLELIDCPINGKGFTNCPSSDPVLYPDDLNTMNKIKQSSNLDKEKIDCYTKIFKFWEIIKFLKWISL